MSARTLVFFALAVRGIDVALGPWGSPGQLFALYRCLVLVFTAIALRSLPRTGTAIVLILAFLSAVSTVRILTGAFDDLDLIVPFFQVRRVLWLAEEALVVAAAIIAIANGVKAIEPRDVARTPPPIRRPLLIGAGCWSATLALIFWWPGPDIGYMLAPLIPLALLSRFLLAHHLGRADAILARVAGWIGVVCCLLTLTPIPYGLVIMYMLMTVRGTAMFVLGLFGTLFLLVGAKALRSSLSSAPTVPDAATAT